MPVTMNVLHRTVCLKKMSSLGLAVRSVAAVVMVVVPKEFVSVMKAMMVLHALPAQATLRRHSQPVAFASHRNHWAPRVPSRQCALLATVLLYRLSRARAAVQVMVVPTLGKTAEAANANVPNSIAAFPTVPIVLQDIMLQEVVLLQSACQ